jgi:hypothetical protein
MENEFIPYEQALALKELGFDEPCFATYQKGLNGPIMWDYWSIELRNSTNEEDEVECTVPLYQQAFRWFREKYQLHSYIEGAYPWFRFYINTEDNRYEGHKHLSFEEAELACLNNLIEITKTK